MTAAATGVALTVAVAAAFESAAGILYRTNTLDYQATRRPDRSR